MVKATARESSNIKKLEHELPHGYTSSTLHNQYKSMHVTARPYSPKPMFVYSFFNHFITHFKRMKKIYTSILAAICVLGANAANFKAVPASEFSASMLESNLKVANAKEAATIVKQERLSPLAVTAESFVGDYDWAYRSLAASGTNATGSASIEAGSSTNQLVFNLELATGLKFSVTGTYSRLTKMVTIPTQALGFNITNSENQVIGEAYFMNVTTSGESIVESATPATATYDEASGSVSISGNLAICTQDLSGIIEITMSNTLQTPITLTELGTGKYFDGIFAPMYGITADKMKEIEVTVYGDDERPGYFLVANPWGQTFGMVSNMEIDASDPTYVLIPYTNTGYNDKSDGITYIASQSYFFANMAQNPLDRDAFLEARGDFNITWDKESNTINIPSNGCFFNWPNSENPNSFYLANSPYSSYLKLPESSAAIDNVAADSNENAPVEYFNLQGVRVDNPAAGQIVIRRQGTNVSKVYVK